MIIEFILLSVAVLLLASIFASKASGRFGVPALVLFLSVGMLAGSEGFGGIYFDNAEIAQFLGVVALVYILFAGGLDTEWKNVRPVVGRAVGLATLGVAITAGLVGIFAAYALGFSMLEGLLLGAIVSSTDAAAVFAVLRARSVGLKGEIKPLLELESGSNDPMAVFLTVGLTSLLMNPEASILTLIPDFFKQMILGALLGYAFGRGILFVLNHVKLEYEGLYPVLTLAFVGLAYSVTALIGGNGFLAVYIAGLVLGNRAFIHKQSIMRFHDGIGWLMQIAMFLTLGLLVFPSKLVPVIGSGLIVALVLMFAARPVSVFLTLAPTGMSWRELTMISWVGLRGAVPIILATFPMLAGVPQAETIFHLVFFIVLTSVLLQGTTLPVAARLLGVDAPLIKQKSYPLEFVQAGDSKFKEGMVEIEVTENSSLVGNSLVQVELSEDTLIVLIGRGNEFIVPNGGTVIEPNDTLLVLASEKSLGELRVKAETISTK